MSTFFFFFYLFRKLKEKLKSVTSVEESPYCVCQLSKEQTAALSEMLLRMRLESHNNICMSLGSVCFYSVGVPDGWGLLCKDTSDSVR